MPLYLINDNSPEAIQGQLQDAKDYLQRVISGGGTAADLSFANTILGQKQNQLDTYLNTKTLQDEKLALEQTQSKTVIIPNTTIDQFGEQIQKPESKGLLIIAGLVVAALVLK